MPSFTVRELGERVDAVVDGDDSRQIDGVASLATAGPSHLSFVATESVGADAKLVRRAGVLADPTGAGALLVPMELDRGTLTCALLRVPEPRLALADLLPLFWSEGELAEGIHASVEVGLAAVIADDVRIGPHVVIGAGVEIACGAQIGPSTLIGDGVRIGHDARIGHSVSILGGARLGDRVILHPGVRIGTDGFGYVPTVAGARKIPQAGGCVIGDDVEIGANCTIDRGALGDTTIGDRTKLDNLVHIAHNVTIGPDCMIVAQVGIAGSTDIGPRVQLGGQVGIAGHITIGAGARIAAQSGVISDVPAEATFGGYPARPHGVWMRANAAVMRLPKLIARVATLEGSSGRSDSDESD